MKRLIVSTLSLALVTLLLNVYARNTQELRHPELEQEIGRLIKESIGKALTKPVVQTLLPLPEVKRISALINSAKALQLVLHSELPEPIKGILLSHADFCNEELTNKNTLNQVSRCLKASFDYEYGEDI